MRTWVVSLLSGPFTGMVIQGADGGPLRRRDQQGQGRQLGPFGDATVIRASAPVQHAEPVASSRLRFPCTIAICEASFT
jgi:hypothetical protein